MTIIKLHLLRHWKSKAAKRVRQFGERHPQLSKRVATGTVCLVAIFVGSAVIYFSSGDDRQTLTTAAQSVIQLAAFLAAASGVLTAIYLGQVLKGIPENVEKTVPPLMTTVNRAITEAASRATDQESQFRLTRDAMNTAFKDWHDAVMGSMGGAKRIRSGGSHPLYLLVASAITAVSVILSGSILLLGLSVGLMVLATWAIFRSWKIAEESMQGVIGTSSFFAGIPREEIRVVHPDPEPVAETNIADTIGSTSRPTARDVAKYLYDIVIVSFFLSIVFAFALLAYSAWYYVSPGTVGVVSDMATLFITVQGVLLAISVISRVADRTFIMFTAMSLMISVITFMLAKVGTPFFVIWGIKNAFGVDAGFFALSIVYYVLVATRNLPKPA
jgi:hypothetical protein